ncbi:OmpA family protein [Rhodoflexus sp.]
MKLFRQLLPICLLAGFPYMLSAQIINPREALKRKTTDRANQKVDQGTDKALDKIEGVFKKKDKNDTGQGNPLPEQNAPEREDNSTRNQGNNQPPTKPASTFTLESYSKFDFVAGEQVIAFEDFSQDAIGDFPDKWNTNGSGEIVTIAGRPEKWLKFMGEGIFYPEFLGKLEDNTTIEFEIATRDGNHVATVVNFIDSKSSKQLLNVNNTRNQAVITLDPVGKTRFDAYDGESNAKMSNDKDQSSWKVPENSFAKISLWRQKSRLRVYINETKVWDIPKAFESSADYRLTFSTITYFLQDREVYLTNFRVAKGAPDTRNKLLTEGKFVTRGITFDVGSDKIKAESYGTLKEIAQVLSENPAIRVRITGHTDSDGNAAQNVELSKKRAAAVKNALAGEFRIDGSRLETDGKGASEPAEPNTTSQGKANNRRVEFTKL